MFVIFLFIALWKLLIYKKEFKMELIRLQALLNFLNEIIGEFSDLYIGYSVLTRNERQRKDIILNRIKARNYTEINRSFERNLQYDFDNNHDFFYMILIQ